MNKINKHIFLLLLAAVAACATSSGQDLSPTDLLNPTADLSSWTAGKTEALHLKQVGTANNVILQQSGSNSSATPNLTRVYQQGDRNFVMSLNQGTTNRTDVLQTGMDNKVYSTVQGNANVTSLVQNGTANVVVQTLTNSNGIDTKLIQNGNNNRIDQTIINGSNQTFRVTQTGDNLRAVIYQNNQF